MKSMKKKQLNGYGKVAVMMAIFVFVFVLFMTPTPASAAIDGTSPNPYGDTIIGNETLWTNETFILNGNLIVNSTGSLSLRNTTLIMNCSSDGQYHIEVQSGGAMYIYDYDNDPVTTADRSNITAINPGYEYYFQVLSSSTFEMRNSELHECGYTWGWNGDKDGLWINTDNTTIENNLITNNRCGIFIYSSNNNTIKGNTVNSNSFSGIYLYESSNNNLTDNIVNSNRYGIYFSISSNNNLANNTMADNNYNFRVNAWSLSEFTQNISTSNTVDGKPIYYLVSEKDQIIDSTSNAGYVAVVNSTNVTVKDLTLEKNYQGVLFAYTSNSRIENISASNNFYGFDLRYSDNNNLTDNIANSNNWGGIVLFYSSNSNLTNNTMADNYYNFEVDARSLSEFTQNIDTSNTVDGKPIYYLMSEKDQIIDSTSNAGYVAVVNSTNVTVKDLTLEKNYQGVLFAYTANSRIENVSASSNDYGFYLRCSDNNNLTDNNASSNGDCGVYLRDSDNNNLTDNHASSNNRGIELRYSDNNNLTDNNVTFNNRGFYLTSSSINNTIANNSIHNNTQYNFYNNQPDNVTAEYNWWGTTDIDAINASIYDYYDDASKGIVDYVPYLTEPPSPPVPSIFDTGPGTYPSIMGTHEGKIIPSCDINVSKLYTYPCAGTGGHTESIELYNESDVLIANGTWSGYIGDYHNITIHNLTGGVPYVTLLKDHEYNYTIKTGSYPQIIHEPSKEVIGGTITCTQFTDVNGRTYDNWIPAIRLE